MKQATSKEISFYDQLRTLLQSKNVDFKAFEEAFKVAKLTHIECGNLLCAAMKNGRLEAVKFLVGSGADISKADAYDSRLAWSMLVEDHGHLFDEMITLGLNPNFKDELLTGHACKSKNTDLIYQFLNTAEQQNVALRHANIEKNMPLFEHVMEKKPVIEDRTIGYAVLHGNNEIAIRLIEAGANIHAIYGSDNLLFLAAGLSNLVIFEYLVSAGVDMHAVGTYNKVNIPVHLLSNGQYVVTDAQFSMIQTYPKESITFDLSKELAFSTCTLNALNYIVSLGAKEKPWELNKFLPKDSNDHVSLWRRFLGYSFEKAMMINADPALFEWLMDQGLDLDVMPICDELRELDYGPTLMHSAAIKGCSNVIPLLVKRGYDVHARTKNGYAPIHFAKSASVIHALVAEGVDINCLSSDGLTVAHLILRERFKMLELLPAVLSSKQFKSDLTDKRGNHYFHWLMLQKWIEISDNNAGTYDTQDVEVIQKTLTEVVEILKNHGSDINAKNRYGATPLDLAPTEFVKSCLISHGATVNPIEIAQETPLTEKSPQLLKPEPQPNVQQFCDAVMLFKKTHQLKSVKMLHDPSNHHRQQQRLAFFQFPVIGSFLTRDTIKVQDRLAVIDKYEQHFYESGSDEGKHEIPYRCSYLHHEQDECQIPKSKKFASAFYHAGSTHTVTFQLYNNLSKQAMHLSDQGVLLLEPYDIYGVPSTLDERAKICVADEGFLFIAMPMIKDNHALTYCAVFDQKNKQTIAVFDCNSWRKESGFEYYAYRVNLDREVEKQFVIIDAAHDLQVEATDGNCALYTYDFCQALLKAFSEDQDLRRILTQYTKQALQADPQKCQDLSLALRHSMMRYLPQYYQSCGDGSFERRPYEAISEYHCQLRWRIGSDFIRDEIAKEAEPAQSQSPPL